MTAADARARRTDPEGWRGNANVRLLAALRELLLDRIPRDPLSTEYRQGNTLGAAHRHWFRAKFGANRFRLFFRADSASRIIVYAWFNNRDTLRKAGATTGPYAVFIAMLGRGNPPDSWASLLAASNVPDATDRLRAIAPDPNT